MLSSVDSKVKLSFPQIFTRKCYLQMPVTMLFLKANLNSNTTSTFTLNPQHTKKKSNSAFYKFPLVTSYHQYKTAMLCYIQLFLDPIVTSYLQ